MERLIELMESDPPVLVVQNADGQVRHLDTAPGLVPPGGEALGDLVGGRVTLRVEDGVVQAIERA